MNVKLLLTAPAVAALAAATLATAPIASATPEDNFLVALANEGEPFSELDADKVVDLGWEVCQDWGAGYTFQQQVDSMAPTEWSDYSIGFFIGAATQALCPNYTNRMPL